MAPGKGLNVLAWISVIALIVIAAYISRPLMGTVMLGILLTYMLAPIYEFAFMKTQSKRSSSLIAVSAVFITLALVILVFYRTIYLGLAGLFSDATLATNITAANLSEAYGSLPDFNHPAGMDESMMAFQAGIIPFLTSILVPAIAKETVNSLIVPIVESGLLSSTLAFPVFLSQLIVASFFAFYLLLNGKDAALRLPNLLPIRQRMVGHRYLEELNGVFKTLLTTNFDIAAYNALVGIIIFSLIGVPFAAAWALMAAFLSLIRFFGPWLVFVPLSISLFLINDFSKGFLVLLFGVSLLEYVPEYILRPYISKGGSPVNSALAFLSYVAPIFVLGPLGVIVGPFVFGLLIAAYRTVHYFSEKEMQS